MVVDGWVGVAVAGAAEELGSVVYGCVGSEYLGVLLDLWSVKGVEDRRGVRG